MRSKFIGLFIVCTILLLNLHCKKDNPNGSAVIDNANANAVCIWDKASIKSDPSATGKWLSSMSLGEKITYSGNEKVDLADKNKKYYQVKLSDGKEGWASEYTVALDSKPAVTIQRTVLYARPDLVTGTDKELGPMEFVAVNGPEKEWCEIKSIEGKKKGWIKSSSLSLKDADITVALLYAKANAEKDTAKKIKMLDNIISDPSLYSSTFADSVKFARNKLAPPAGMAKDSVGH